MPSLFYRKSGKGPVVVILHGLYGMSDNWMGIARLLSDRFTVIAVDVRNHGRSFHDDIHSFSAMVADLEQLVAELSIQKFILMGHSMGGKVAMHYAMKNPEKLNGLVVVDISPLNYRTDDSNYVFHTHVLTSLSEVDASHLSSRQEAFDLLSPMLPDEKLLNFLLKNLAADSKGKFYWMLNLPVLLNTLAAMAGGFDPGYFTEPVSGFPVYFLKGEKSYYIKDEYHPEIYKLFPAAEIIAVPDAGHWLHQEKPEAVINVFDKMIDYAQ